MNSHVPKICYVSILKCKQATRHLICANPKVTGRGRMCYLLWTTQCCCITVNCVPLPLQEHFCLPSHSISTHENRMEGCSKSNASYFITLAHNIRGRCWWYDSRGWTFPSIFHYSLLLCDRLQQKSSLTEWNLTWERVWSKGVSLNSSMRKKWHPLTFIDTCWVSMETKQWMWAQWGSGGALQQWQQQHERQAMIWMTMQIFTRVSCGLLLIDVKNAWLMVVTMLKNSVLWLMICSIRCCYFTLCICCSFHGNK